MKIIIVGGVAGGATAAARLRRLDEKAEIILFERGEYISFANCGLPYYVSGIIWDKEELLLQTPESFNARYNVDVRVLNEVVSIDKENKIVEVLNRANGKKYTENYDKLLLSMGASPIVPPLPGMDLPGVFTLRTVPDIEKIKAHIKEKKASKAVVVGGGFIGVEMAENLVFAGLEVTIVEMASQLVATVDHDMVRHIHKHVQDKGVRLVFESGLERIDAAREKLCIKTSTTNIEADVVILAVGVRPETAIAKNAGLSLGMAGSIMVDEKMRTSDENIFAVGDAVEITNFITQEKGLIPLAGPANKQARVAADNIAGLETLYKGTQGSSVLKVFDLTVASTGLNEKQAERAGLEYGKVLLSALSNAGYYPGAKDTYLKVLFEQKSGRILGAQVVGEKNADKRCDVIATAIRFGATADDLTQLELCYAPPFGSAKDPVNMAGYMIENILSGKVEQVSWQTVNALPSGSATLLDVRGKGEIRGKELPGFMNIPLNSLRERIQELPKDKKVYVSCLSGQRSYVACTILKGHGYKCFNISGGYKFFI